MKLSDAMRNL